jgi:hypothetical protein
VKTSITLSASEAKALLDTGRVTVLRLLSPQPTQDLRPLVEAITGEVWWGHDVGERAPDRGVIEYEDGTLRSVSPGRVKTWRCPWKGELAVRLPAGGSSTRRVQRCGCSLPGRYRGDVGAAVSGTRLPGLPVAVAVLSVYAPLGFPLPGAAGERRGPAGRGRVAMAANSRPHQRYGMPYTRTCRPWRP